METVFKIVNSIRGSALQRRLFRFENEDNDKELLLHTNVRWLSRSRFLMRFLELLEDVKSFLSERGDSYPQLTNKEWLLDISFLADFSSKLNDLNLELQGKGRNVLDMISSILLKANLKDKKFKHWKIFSDIS